MLVQPGFEPLAWRPAGRPALIQLISRHQVILILLLYPVRFPYKPRKFIMHAAISHFFLKTLIWIQSKHACIINVHLLQEYMEIIPYFQLKLCSSVYYLQVMRLSYWGNSQCSGRKSVVCLQHLPRGAYYFCPCDCLISKTACTITVPHLLSWSNRRFSSGWT